MKTAIVRAAWLWVLSLFLLVFAIPHTSLGQQATPSRMKVTFTGYTKTLAMTNFPALVALSQSLPNFLYSQFASTNGYDLRFYDASKTNELAYEIEAWNTGGVSYVWVKVPVLAASNDYVWACWGDGVNASRPAYTTNGAVWAADYRLVMHMTNANDSSTNRISGAASAMSWSAGLIGNAGTLNGSSSQVAMNHHAALKPSSQLTLSSWVKPANLTNIQYRNIYRKEDLSARHTFAFQEFGTILSFGLSVGGVYNELDVPIAAANYTGQWHLITAVYDGSMKRLYCDGVETGKVSTSGAIDTSGTALGYVGCTDPPAEYFHGAIDEFSLSGSARASNWVWASWQNQRTGSTFLSFDTAPVVSVAPPTLAFAATYGGGDPATQPFTISNLFNTTVAYTNAISYGAGASGWFAVAATTGSVSGLALATHTGSVSITGLNVGTYTATNTLMSMPSMTPLGYIVATITVAKASQTITFPGIADQLSTNVYNLGATASSGLAVSFAVASGPATISGSTNVTFTGTGTVSIVASQSGNGNWNAATPVTNTFAVIAPPTLPRRMKVTFSGYSKQEALISFPALIALSEGLPDFLYSQFVSLSGHDLRFYDASGTTELAYEVEKWDTGGVSFVWVNIPCLTSSNDYVWACWGDASQSTQPAYTTNGATWSADYRLVMHMESALDSSTNMLTGTAGTDVVFTNGHISDSCMFNGVSSRIRKDHNPVLKPSSQITISAWIKPANVVAVSPEIFRKEDGVDRHLLGFQTSGTMLTLGLNIGGAYKELDVPISAANYTDAWHLVTAVYDGSAMLMYRDGVQIGKTNVTGAISTVGTSNAYVGCNHAINEWFQGGIDELSVSGTGRSSNWIWACWQNQKAGTTFLTHESLPAIGIAPSSLQFSATYGGSSPAGQVFVVTNRGYLAGDYTNVISYGFGGSGWLSVAAAAGSLASEGLVGHTGSVVIGGLNAGTYVATNTLLSIPSMTPLGDLVVTLTVAKASQAITFPGIAGQLTTNLCRLSASASSGLAVSFAVGSGPATISDGTNLTFTGPGTVSIVASQSGNGNWNAATPVTNTFDVSPAAVLPCRMKVTFSGYTKQEPLTNFPALVVLSQGMPGFLYSQFASPDGHDLRFYDASGINELAYEIEKWDVNGSSFVWVKIPCLTGSNDYVWAYWGDEAKNVQPAYTTNGAVWSADYRLVLHMADSSDSSTNVISGSASNVTWSSAIVGDAGWFNGSNSMVQKSQVTALKPTSAITMSAWVRPSDITNITYREVYRKNDAIGRHLLSFQGSGTILSFGLGLDSGYSELDVPINAADYTNAWHLITAVYDGAVKRLYRDGVEIGYTNTTGAIASSNFVPAYVGCSSGAAEWFDGGIDEMRVSGVGRSSNWVWACWQNQKAGSDFVTYERLPVLMIAPSTILFNASYSGANPPAQEFLVTNLSTVSGAYTNMVSYGAGGSSWFGAAASTGSLPGEASATHTGSVTIAGLSAGVYTATNILLSIPSMTHLGHVAVTLSVSRASQAITFSGIPGQLTTNLYRLSASASSGLAVSFAVASGPGVIASGTNLTFTGTGTVRVVASQAGNANWALAPSVTNTIVVSRLNQTGLLFAPTSPQSYGTTNMLCTTGGSGTGVVTYVVQSGPGQIVNSCWLAAVLGTGAVTVVATKAADFIYNACSVTSVVTVAKAGQSITFPAISDQWVTNTVWLSAKSSSGMGVSFSVGSGPATISGGSNLTFSGAGTVKIVASQAGNANVSAAPSVTNTFRCQTFRIESLTAAQIGDASGRVQINYTLGCHPTTQVANVTVAFSTNAGQAWTTLNSGVMTGDFGAGIGFGARLAVWNAASEPIRNYNTLIRLVATTGSETVTNVSDRFNLDVLSLNSGLRVRGRICSATTRMPLGSADIRIANTNIIGAVLTDGYFDLPNLGIVFGNTLTVSNAGFAAVSQQITVPAGAVEIAVPTIYLQPLPPSAPVVTSLQPKMQGIFVHGVKMNNDFTATVNWNGLVHDWVGFYANGSLVKEWANPTGSQFTCTINMGQAFAPSFAQRANRLEVLVYGHDSSTLEVATNMFAVYPCVIPLPGELAWMAQAASFDVPGSFSLNLDIPPEPWDAVMWLPVVGKFGFKFGIPVSFAYSIPRGGAWEFKAGGKGSGKTPGKGGTKLYVGQKEIELIIQGLASGVANTDRGIALDKVGVHAELNVRLQLGWVGLLDVVPGASSAASTIPGGSEAVRKISVGIFLIPGVSGDLVGKVNPGLTFDSFLITGKVGLEGSYEPEIGGGVSARIYVGGEPSVTVGFPGDFFKNVRFRAYAGAEFKWWIFRLAYENVFVDVQYPAALAAAANGSVALFDAGNGTPQAGVGGSSGQQQFVVLHGVNNNKLRTIDRGYLLNGGERFLAADKTPVGGGSANESGKILLYGSTSSQAMTQMDAFRAIGQGRKVEAAVAGPVVLKDGEPGPILVSDYQPITKAAVDIIGNGFPNASPALAGISSNLMLLYVADNGSPNDLQFTDIHWTRYDGWNWSVPTSIVTDTRCEFSPQVKFDGNGDAIAVWTRVSDPDFDTMDITAMSAELEIVWARWDHLTGVWTEPSAITTNTWIDHAPLLAGPMTNGDLMATWVVNTANLTTGTGVVGSAENDAVMWSRWNGAGREWSPPQVLVSNVVARNAQSLAAASNMSVYAWSADPDGNQEDDTDVEVYARVCSNGTWLGSIRCTSNSVPDKNVRVAVSAAGTVHMVWQQESNMVSALNFSASPAMVRPESGSVGFSDFAMTYSPQGNMVLLWQEMTTNGSDAHYSVYDPAADMWSKDATLFDDAALERSFSPVWDDVGNLAVAYNAVEIDKTNVVMELEGGGSITVSNVPQPGAVSLAVVKKALVTDVAILAGDFSVSGANYLPGDALTFSTVLRNVGDIPVSNAVVAFYQGNPLAGGVLVTNVAWDGWIEGAETDAVCTAVWTLPEPGTSLVFYAVANPNHTITEFTENNNTQAVSVGGTDLSVTLVSVAAETNGSLLVVAKVENVGSPGATNTTLAIRRKGESGAPLAAVAVPVLESGMNVQLAIDLGAGTQPEGEAAYVLNADEGNIVADVATNNDQVAFSVNLWRDADEDGMPDGWELSEGFDPNSADDANGDADSDGMSNYAEWRAGTKADDPDSFLSVVGLSVAVGDSPVQGFRLSWGSESNKFYSVSRATNLVDGIGFVPLSRNIQATPPVNTYDDTTIGTGGGSFFYRIDVE